MKKELGQHFLRQVPTELTFPIDDLEKIQSLQRATKIHILEIGPGNGIVTEAVLKQLLPFSKLNILYEIVDIDKEAIEATKERIKGMKLPKRFSIKYVHKDIIKHNIKPDNDTYIYIYGSLPYNISKKIVNWTIIQFSHFDPSITYLPSNFLIQKEVAEDYSSKPPKASFIGMALQQHSEKLKITKKVPPGAFYPPPKVNSAILKIFWKQNIAKSYNSSENLVKVMKMGFSARRKMVKSIFRNKIPKENLTPTLEHILHMRAQELSEREWEMIRQSLKK